ncbi:MAG TPA: type II toxin-antitoxin system VapC family toxin [Ruania sp.]|nr:type II toxin-antitoxin system VapC family toxin [Ruania sp.]
MIIYLDTSAVVPLMVQEPSSATCTEVWEKANRVLGTRLVYVEATAALAMAVRTGRIDANSRLAAQDVLEQLWQSIDVLEVDESLMKHAAWAAGHYDLRGYDAVHYAAAHSARDDDLVAVSADQRLIAAWMDSGLATLDTTP